MFMVNDIVKNDKLKRCCVLLTVAKLTLDSFCLGSTDSQQNIKNVILPKLIVCFPGL